MVFNFLQSYKAVSSEKICTSSSGYVEVGHIEKDQIAEEAKGFSTDPKSPDFQRAYTPLMNMATRFMIQYRDEKGMPIIPYNFAPVVGYQLKLDAHNQKRKDEMKPKSD